MTKQDSPTTIVKVTGQVHNNVLLAQLPEAPDEQRQATIFYGPTGNVLRRFGRVSRPATSNTCTPGPRFRCGQPPRIITDVLGSLSRRPPQGQRLSQDFLRNLVWQGSGIYASVRPQR